MLHQAVGWQSRADADWDEYSLTKDKLLTRIAECEAKAAEFQAKAEALEEVDLVAALRFDDEVIRLWTEADLCRERLAALG